MKIEEAKVELWDNPATQGERMKHVERAARVCYRSEDRISDGSAEKLIEAVMRRGHMSVIEHGNIILKPSLGTRLWLYDAEKQFINSNKRSFLRYTNGINPIVSGNIRAWFDLLKLSLSGYSMLAGAPNEIITMIHDNWEFFSHMSCTNAPFTIVCGRPIIWKPCEVFGLEKNMPKAVRAFHNTHTLHFTVDRGVSHELVRHRVFSFSQESTRYCNYANDKFNHEITVIQPAYAASGTALHASWYVGCLGCEIAYFQMLDTGATAQEARSVLPNSLKTEVVMTGHDNDWLGFLKLRTASDAHPDMRRVATQAARLLYEEDPEVFSEYEGNSNE